MEDVILNYLGESRCGISGLNITCGLSLCGRFCELSRWNRLLWNIFVEDIVLIYLAGRPCC